MKITHSFIAVFIGVMAMITLTGFSQENEYPPARDTPGSRPGSETSSSGEDLRDWGADARIGEMGILGNLAGMDIIRQKYQIKIQRVFLDAKEQTLAYREEQRALLDRLFELCNDFDNDQAKNKKEILGILEKLRNNRQNIDTIHETAMEKIKALHQEQKKEIEKALDEEMKKLRTDDKEMIKFIETVKNLPPSRRPHHSEPERIK